ncbi:MAG: rRNA maturation RNase YbeY [Candidatus Paceibacteria bacterium]
MKNSIHILCQVKSALKYKRYIKKYTSYLLHYLSQNKNINIIICNDKKISQIHKNFLDDDSPTDVISFHSYDIENFLGELVINIDFAKRECKKRKIAIEEELCRYITHGALHILGYKDSDKKSKKLMWAKQEEILKGYLK